MLHMGLLSPMMDPIESCAGCGTAALMRERHTQAQSAVIQEQMAAQAASQKQAMEELLAIMSASMHRELPQLVRAPPGRGCLRNDGGRAHPDALRMLRPTAQLKTTMKAHADSMVTQISSAAGSAIAAAVAEQMRGALPGPVQAAVQQALADKLEPALTGPVQVRPPGPAAIVRRGVVHAAPPVMRWQERCVCGPALPARGRV